MHPMGARRLGRSAGKASDFPGEQRRSVRALHMLTLTPALARTPT